MLALTVLACVSGLAWLGWQDAALIRRAEALQAGRFGVWEVAQLQRQLLRLQGAMNVIAMTGRVADAETLRREMDLVLSRIHILNFSDSQEGDDSDEARRTVLPRIISRVETVGRSLDAVLAEPSTAGPPAAALVDEAVRLSQEFFSLYFNEQNKRAARTTQALADIRRNRTVLNALVSGLVVLLLAVLWTWFRARLRTMADLVEERAAGERRLRHLMDLAIQGIMVHRNFKLLYLNDSLAQMVGYPDAATAAREGHILDFIHPEDRAHAVTRYPQRMAGVLPPDAVETRVYARDGSQLWMEVRAQAIQWDGAPAALVTCQDITVRKASEEALRAARDEAQAASRAKSHFLASMSHELRTPLTSIIGFTQLMLKGIYGPLPQGARDALTDVAQSGEHLLSLVNDVLDLARIEAQRMDLELAEWPAAAAAQTVVRRLRPQAEEKHLALEMDFPPDLRCRYDLRRMTQILLNLVGNAIKFTESGHVRLEARKVGAEVCFAVHDTGVGLSAEQQQALFQEFQQVDSTLARQSAGTGLGLAITKRLVELHGGRIWVESQPGEGSVFRFCLPLGDKHGGRTHPERGGQSGPEADAPPVS